MSLPYTYPLTILKLILGLSKYKDLNPAPASLIASDIASIPSRAVLLFPDVEHVYREVL